MGKIGCIGFGGGSALIPVIEEEIVKKQKLDTRENLDKDIIVASITPGALPVEIAASVGKRNFGRAGMIMGAVMMAFPGTLASILLMTILSVMQEQVLPIIELISAGVSVFIIYLLLAYIIKMLRECASESKARLWEGCHLNDAVFLMVCEKNIFKLFGIDRTPILSISTVQVLFFAFFCIFYSRSRYNAGKIAVMLGLGTIYLLGTGKAQLLAVPWLLHLTELLMVILAVWGIWQNIRESSWKLKKRENQFLRDVGIWLLLLVIFSVPAVLIHRDALPFLGKGVLSTLMSFGGGDAYLTIAEGLFVEPGLITENQYYSQIIPVVNVLPGSILCKTLASVGYYIVFNLTGSLWAGILFAVAGFICSIAISCGFFMLIYHFYNDLVSLWAFRLIGRWIRPIIAGLLLDIVLSLVNQCVTVLGQFL